SAGTAITLGASAVDPNGGQAANTFTYLWTISKNGASYTTGSGASFTFTPDGPGTFLATLVARNLLGTTSHPVRATINVTDVPPTATIQNAPTTDPAGTAISLSGSATSPSPVEQAAGFSYAWSVTKNGAAYTTGSGAAFSFTPDGPGTFVVSLTA